MDTGRGDEFELMRGVGSKDSGEEGIRAIEESVNPAVWNSKPSQMMSVANSSQIVHQASNV